MNQSTADPGTRLAEELKLLLDAVADRAGPWLDRLAASSHEEHDTGCGWCPLCALVAVLRGQPAELTGVVLDRAADLIALLRAVLADRWEPGTLHMPGFRPSSNTTTTEERYPGDAGAPRVQRIPVRRSDR